MGNTSHKSKGADFFSLLSTVKPGSERDPYEKPWCIDLREYLLSFVDLETIFKICLVCKSWNRTISSMPAVWKHRTIALGGTLGAEKYSKSLFITYAKIRKCLFDGSLWRFDVSRAFPELLLPNPEQEVMLFDISDDFYATSSVILVTIWRRGDPRPADMLLWAETATAMCFEIGEALAVGGHRGGVKVFAVDAEGRLSNGTFSLKYHTVAVTCISLHMPLNLLITADLRGFVCAWSIKEEKLLRIFYAFENPLEVEFAPATGNLNCHHLVVRRIDCMKSFFWNTVAPNHSQLYGDLDSAVECQLLNTVDLRFVSGCFPKGGGVCFLETIQLSDGFGTDLIQITYASGVPQRVVEHLNMNFKVLRILGLGSVFCLLLLGGAAGASADYKVGVFDRSHSIMINLLTLPYSWTRSSVPRVVAGPVAWLDCLRAFSPDNVVLSYAGDMDTTTLRFYLWNNFPDEQERQTDPTPGPSGAAQQKTSSWIRMPKVAEEGVAGPSTI